jgi:hypothetical protein
VQVQTLFDYLQGGDTLEDDHSCRTPPLIDHYSADHPTAFAIWNYWCPLRFPQYVRSGAAKS